MSEAIAQDQSSQPAIVIRDLHHTYSNGHQALTGVNLTCGTGVYGLLGPNGAGKSSLMRILCTLQAPTSGEVTVCGVNINKDRLAVRANLGYLPQEFGAWRLHKVREVVDTLAQLSGMHDKKVRKARVAEVLEQVGLTQVAHRKVKKLSGGMLRRVGVAQALVHAPKIIVVDEPTVGLDPEERIRFRQLMAELGRDRTILLSTHIVADLGAACQEIALLDSGEIIFQGSPSSLVAGAVGQVFQVVATELQVDDIESNYDIVSTTVSGSNVILRGVAGEQDLPDGAEVVKQPTLEEGYMAFMASRGRGAAARQDEEKK